MFLVSLPFAFVGLVVIVCLGYIVFTYDNSITVREAKEYKSREGNKKAVLYVAMWGGAAGGCAHALSILAHKDTLDVNVFRSDKTVFLKRCGNDNTEVKWVNDSSLSVRFLNEDVRKQEPESHGVKILYKPYTLPKDRALKMDFMHPKIK